MGPFLKIEYFIKNWFWLGENASKWSELHFTSSLGGFMAILDPPQSRNWNFLVSETIMVIIFETKGEFPQNFETTSDLEVLYFKEGLQSFNSEF